MKLKQTDGRDVPGIPGATLRKKVQAPSGTEPDELLERLLADDDDEDAEDERFIPQQELVQQ